ncbi:MAG: tRNA (adenosine(37)-N6)-threonylcarbamoyltransferase complex ATPase subunit type 1 TsaE [Phycisphaerae bacterium]|nr:tRNA (adenosine(37)-N6)-threonylcarbamoyltransferase complex ATPase subunit type 1 TsaE [Phycisphaerae bacterium]
MKLISTSVSQTIELGQKLGQAIKGGEIFALDGQLGAGKTHLIKGIAQGLEVYDQQSVTSPTFTLINEYEGRLMLYHIDAYRLDHGRQLESLGFDEISHGMTVVVVEWAEIVCDLLKNYNTISIKLAHISEHERQIEFINLPDYLAETINDQIVKSNSKGNLENN